jgi:hypothetical protein
VSTKQNPMDRAYAAGFACGQAGTGRSARPTKGPVFGYAKGMLNRWDEGYDEGERSARFKVELNQCRDDVAALLVQADNSISGGDYAGAGRLFSTVVSKLRGAEARCAFLGKATP